MRMSFFETEKSSSEPGGCRGLEKLLQKNLKKCDKKIKKFLTNKNGNDILIKLSARKADNT